MPALSPTMTLRDLENGNWYLAELKNFAERIGIPAAKGRTRKGASWIKARAKRKEGV